ncbi:MAG: S-layer homology domain-containing protein [Acidimicrobiia bacterium]
MALWTAQPADAEDSLSLLVERSGVGPFADDDGSVFEGDIVALWAEGIVSGCEQWAFCPDRPITRGELAAILRRSRPELFPDAENRFSDVASSVFAADIAAIAAAGVTTGCGGDRFCPDGTVTRETMAALLRRTFHDVLTPLEMVSFRDMSGSVFADDVAWLAGTGVTSGCGAESFCPNDPVTRGQLAAFLRRALDLPSVVPPGVVMVDLSVPAGPGVEGWRPLVEHFFEAGDVERALAVMACESKGDPDAKNPRSTASGLFQHLASQWGPRAEAIGFPDAGVFDPVANTAAAAWLVYEGGGWSHWNASRGCW